MGLFPCSVNVKLEQDRGCYLFQVEFGNNKTNNKKTKNKGHCLSKKIS